jgi:predicted SAM-dependent methyltransferase
MRLANGQTILEPITVEWHRHRNALALPTNINTIEFFADRMEVGVAREGVARRCLEHDPRPEYVFFLDWDVLPDIDALTKLFFRLQTHPDIDMACGVYCLKGGRPADPLIYAGFGVGPYWDWAIGDLLTTASHGITGIHMGLTLIRTSLFQRMLDAGVVNEETPFFQTTHEMKKVNGVVQTRQGTEDLWFCALAEKVGCQIMVDTSVLAGHIDKRTGIIWGLPEDSPPVQRAKWLTKKDREPEEIECPECCGWSKEMEPCGKEECDTCKCEKCGGTGKVKVEPKLALDLGAGGHRREWPGHRTYTTDIRPEVKPDYCQDTLKLNIPDNHYDLVCSSHHLEHLGRWDQETAWAEIYRVCKPGGRIEHIVPSVEWAAAKIMDGQYDSHCLDVLYGAQESHGYARHLNLHYFGYTRDVARALAEQAGFVDVECRDWRDDENAVYNLTITGRKPDPASVPEATEQKEGVD